MFPSESVIQMASSTVKKESRMWRLFSEFCLSVLLVTIVSVALNKWDHDSSCVFRKSLVDTFVRVRYNGNLTFSEVRPLINLLAMNMNSGYLVTYSLSLRYIGTVVSTII